MRDRRACASEVGGGAGVTPHLAGRTWVKGGRGVVALSPVLDLSASNGDTEGVGDAWGHLVWMEHVCSLGM